MPAFLRLFLRYRLVYGAENVGKKMRRLVCVFEVGEEKTLEDLKQIDVKIQYSCMFFVLRIRCTSTNKKHLI